MEKGRQRHAEGEGDRTQASRHRENVRLVCRSWKRSSQAKGLQIKVKTDAPADKQVIWSADIQQSKSHIWRHMRNTALGMGDV